MSSSGDRILVIFSSKSVGQHFLAYYAEFPPAFKTHLYSLRPSDLVTIDGTLKANAASNNLKVVATGYELNNEHSGK